MKKELLIIDPQVDFCDPSGSLYVPGAENDMSRLSAMIDKNLSKIKNIHITLDCHHLMDVAHPAMWINSSGDNPSPFTLITSDDIKNGKWAPFMPSLRQRMIDYCESLENSSKKYPLIIWPPHCLIGTKGNNVYPVLMNSILEWQKIRKNNIDFVSKGSNPYTEHYSAVKAEVPDPNDVTTQINARLIRTLENADEIWIGGEAGSHCVPNTVIDIADNFSDSDCIKKMVLMIDAISPVPKVGDGPDFPAMQQKFIEEMVKRGMRVAKTTDF